MAKKKQVKPDNRHDYPPHEKPQRTNTSLPLWLKTALIKTFDMGHRGNGRFASVMALGAVLVLYGTGSKTVSAEQAAAAVTRLFPAESDRQVWASNLAHLAEQMGNDTIPNAEALPPT